MADNVAQSIKDLQKDLSQLDKQVLSTKEGWDALVNTVVKGMEKSGASVRDLYKEVSSKASAKDVLKIQAVLEFDKKKLQEDINRIQNAIKIGQGSLTLNGERIRGVPAMKSALAELQNQMRAIPKSGAEAYDVIYRVVERYNTARQKTIEKNDKILSQLIKEEEREKAITREIERRQAKERNKLVSSNTSARLADEKRATQMINAEYKARERYAAEREKYIRNLESTNHLARMRDEQRSTQMINAEYKKREKEAERHKRQIESTNRSLESMLPTLRRFAGAFGVAFSVQGLVQFGKKLVETRGEFELQQVALRSILQNKQVADEIWDKTMKAALQSPFTAMQLTRYTKQLAAYRIETDKLFDTTKRLADVSAGLGVDMQRLILAYGQVKAANYLRASEIRQFTEAGVNILGELSTYFSKTRGEMISTAQVMDMVQKRMVKFEDVEAIFKRMTDEGGIFYNMQYIQSQTVKGQINKLHDAYDQMLNSIGKGNEGVLKDIVAALNNIVQNWRYWAAAIKSIAFGTIIASLTKLGVTLTGVNVAGIAAGKGMTKLAGGVKALGVALKGNLLTLVIGTVVSLAAELYNLNKRMKDVNAEIDEQNLNLFETKERLEGYQDAIERNNKALEGGTGNEEKLKKKREENAEILAKLKSDYPQLAEGMEMQKNGVIDLTDALKKENEELERQITLNTLMKQSSIFDENFTKDATDLSKEYIKQQQQIIAARAQALSMMVQLEQIGAKDSLQYNTLKQIADINPDDIQKAYERLIELRHILYNDLFTYNGKSPAPGTYEPLVDYYRKYLRVLSDVSGAENELGDEFNKLGEYVGYELEKGLEEAYKEEIEKSGLSTLQWYALNVNKVQKDVNDGVVDIYRFLRESLEKNGQAQGPGMQAFWNNIVKTNYIDPYFKAWKLGMEEAEAGGWRFPMALPTEGGMPNIFATSKKGDGTSTSTFEDDGSKAKKNASRLISLIREMRSEYDKLSKSAYGYAKSEDVVRESYRQSVKEILGKAGITDYDFTTNAGMIAALERVKTYAQKLGPEAAAEVEKYIGQLKTEMTINAQVRIREDFGRQMEEAFGNYELTLDLQKLNLSSDVLSDLFNLETVGLSDLRRKVVEFYNERAAAGADPTELVKQVEGYYKKIDDMERKQQRERIKEYAKYLEYELSERAKIEMEYTRKSADVAANPAFTQAQKKQIQKRLEEERDKAVAKQEWEDFKSSETYIQMMEDLEHQGTNALMAMRVELERMRENAENLSPRALKEVVNALEKIDEIALKRGLPISNIISSAYAVRGARVGAMESGLLFDQVSSRKAAKQTQADIKAQLLPMEQQFNLLQSQLGAEKEIARLEQERYENGRKLEEIFGEAFLTGDNEYLQELISSRLADMESSQNKIAELTEQRKSANEGDLKVIDKQLAEEQSNIESLMAENELLQKQLKYNLAIAKAALNRAATPEERASLQARIDAMEEELEKLRGQDAAVGELTKKYGILDESIVKAIENFKNMLSTFDSFKTMMDSFGVDTSTGGWAMLDAAKQTVGAMADVAGKIASGDYIGAAIAAVTGIFESIAAWNKASDQYLQDTIEEEQRRIEALRDAYARLERQIEKTWTTIDYMNTYEQQVENIRAQIRSMEAQLAAERDKKNTDDNAVRQYQRDIQDAYDQLEELEQKSIEVFGGIGEEGYRSAAQGFVEAWKSAFLETGDGLQGLQDHFDEFLQNWFVNQATMRIAGGMLERVFRQIDSAVDAYGEGGTSAMLSEIERVRDMAAAIFPDLSLALEDLAGMFGVGGEGSLSGLAAGIQGMTEEQANILEAYWNSVRMYTASIDMNVSRIAEMLGAGGPNTNPMLAQLKTIAENTGYIKDIYKMLDGTRRNLGNGQGFITYNQ